MTRRSLLAAAASAALARPACWLLFDTANQTCREVWPDAGTGVGLGSILKPFLLLAYQGTHRACPDVFCKGSASGCWYRRGHGHQDARSALANSCNTYFLQIASATDRAALESVCLSYGLSVPLRSWTPERLIGLSDGWPQTPRQAAQAFAGLARDWADPRVALILAGMARCASVGTAREISLACYAKTGTAPCVHVPKVPGDGYTLAMYPIGQPRRVLLVQRHNTTGAVSARDAKSLLASLV